MFIGVLLLFLHQLNVVLIEVWDCLDTLEEVEEWVVLVWSVDGIAAESESHEDALGAENLFKTSYDRDASAAAGWYRTFAKSGGHSLLGCLVSGHFERTYIGCTSMAWGYLYGYAVRCCCFEIVLEKLADFLVVLVGYEAGANLGIGF